MVAPTDMKDLQVAWRALANSGEGDGWKTIQISATARYVLLAGRRLPGDEEAILVGFRAMRMPPNSQLPQGDGFEVCRLASDSMRRDRRWLALARRTNGNFELFSMMAEDLVHLLERSETQDDDDLVSQFVSRVRAWQDFMDRHQEGVLSPEAELGLFGELILVDQMIQTGMPAKSVVDSWQGPLDGLQDFILGGGGIEVKTTLFAAGFRATITSLEQLDDSLCQPLFLAAVRLTIDLSGRSLPALADSLRERLSNSPAALAVFEVRLMQAGLLRLAAERYTRRFTHVATSVLPVKDGFPRLTRAHVHRAVRTVRYEIDIDLAGVSDIGIARALELLEAI